MNREFPSIQSRRCQSPGDNRQNLSMTFNWLVRKSNFSGNVFSFQLPSSIDELNKNLEKFLCLPFSPPLRASCRWPSVWKTLHHGEVRLLHRNTTEWGGWVNLIHLHLIMPVGTPRWPQSRSSLKLIASIPFPRIQVHLSSLSAGSTSSPSPKGPRCKMKHCFQGSHCQQLSDASQNDTKWAVERSLLWVGPCVQYIKLLTAEAQHCAGEVCCTVCRTGMGWCWTGENNSWAKHLLPVLWALDLPKAQQLWPGPSLANNTFPKQVFHISRPDKDSCTILSFSTFSTSISRDSLSPAIYSDANTSERWQRGTKKGTISSPPLLPL